MSIRYQLLVPLILLLLGLVGVCTWTALDSARLARQRITTQVNGVVGTLSEAQFPLKPHVLEMTKGLSGAEYLLIEPDGTRTATISGRPERLPEPVALGVDSLGDRILVDGKAYFCRGIVPRPGTTNSGSTLYILYPESLLDEAIRQAVRPSLVLGLSGGLAALLLSLIVGQRLVVRLRDLERRTRQIAAGDFSPMPMPTGNDELRDLAKSVNDMAGRLALLQDANVRTERTRLLGQLSDGLAHQLRNAVTGAKLAMQLHADSCAGGDAEALRVAERQLSRMAADLGRFFDVGLTGNRREACSLGPIIDDAIALLRPQCRHAGIDLRWPPPGEDVVVAGDPGQLGHLILNLVTNAVEAVAANGSVEICLRRGTMAEIEISDSGPGPDPGLAERIFEPFVTGKPEGVGLGLAVTQDVARAHGGSIRWERNNGRTIFHVSLPLHEAGKN